MVRGLAQFRAHFQGYEDYFAVIGGTACDIWLTSHRLEFRRTRDLDLVLIAERLDRAFAARFRAFITAGGYEHVAKATGRPVYYRFTAPKSAEFPEVLELFSQRPSRLALVPARSVVRLEIDAEPASLSAILLDNDYYELIRRYRVVADGLPGVSPGAMIPMKTYAWLNLTCRLAAGEHVDAEDISKHRNDVFRLVLSLTGTERFPVPATVAAHLLEFLAAFPPDSAEWDAILKSLRMPKGRIAPEQLVRTLSTAFELPAS